MAKHHHQSKAEQIDNKAHNAVTFHHERISYRANEVPIADDSSIQIRAYQIHQEKGGSAMDNWLEAERAI
jgi:hypothetical protein